MEDWINEERFYGDNDYLTDSEFNMKMGLAIVYGLLVNFLLCWLAVDIYTMISPLLFLVLYFISSFTGIFISKKSDNPIVSFIGYNLVVLPVGLVVSSVVTAYGLSSSIVREAFLYTMIISISMTIIATLKPEWFRGLGGILFSILLGLVVAELICLIFRIDQVITSWVGAGLFSVYIGYDYYKAQTGIKTLDRAIDCALDIYLDIINLFLKLLRILARSQSKD